MSYSFNDNHKEWISHATYWENRSWGIPFLFLLGAGLFLYILFIVQLGFESVTKSN